MLFVRRMCLAALAILMAAFVALYPYLGGMGHCGVECPYAAQSSHEGSTGLAAACVSAVLAASPAALAFAAFRGRRVTTDGWRPTEIYLLLDPPPPRPSPSR